MDLINAKVVVSTDYMVGQVLKASSSCQTNVEKIFCVGSCHDNQEVEDLVVAMEKVDADVKVVPYEAQEARGGLEKEPVVIFWTSGTTGQLHY